MFNCNLIVLSYHRFNESESDYPFSRTYEQFEHDVEKKVYDWITIDDGHRSIIPACDIMRSNNMRAKIFISTALVGTAGYCTLDEIAGLARFHDIENHSHNHVDLTKLAYKEVYENVLRANNLIHDWIGSPRYFVPPFNQRNAIVEKVAKELDLIIVKDRITIKNNSK